MRCQVLNNSKYCKLGLRFNIRIGAMTGVAIPQGARIDETEEYW